MGGIFAYKMQISINCFCTSTVNSMTNDVCKWCLTAPVAALSDDGYCFSCRDKILKVGTHGMSIGKILDDYKFRRINRREAIAKIGIMS